MTGDGIDGEEAGGEWGAEVGEDDGGSSALEPEDAPVGQWVDHVAGGVARYDALSALYIVAHLGVLEVGDADGATHSAHDPFPQVTIDAAREFGAESGAYGAHGAPDDEQDGDDEEG